MKHFRNSQKICAIQKYLTNFGKSAILEIFLKISAVSFNLGLEISRHLKILRKCLWCIDSSIWGVYCALLKNHSELTRVDAYTFIRQHVPEWAYQCLRRWIQTKSINRIFWNSETSRFFLKFCVNFCCFLILSWCHFCGYRIWKELIKEMNNENLNISDSCKTNNSVNILINW